MYCKTCYTIGHKYPLRFEKSSGDLWLASCTNPNHLISFYVKYVQQPDGDLRLVRVRTNPVVKKESYTVGDYTYYWDGQKKQKIKTSYMKDIQSRAVREDGSVISGDAGIKYNKERGAKYGNDSVIGL